MILAVARVYLESPRRLQVFTLCAVLCVMIGILYGVLAGILCTNNWGCIDTITCLCYPPPSLIISHFLGMFNISSSSFILL